MKNVLSKITCLMIAFMAVGCTRPVSPSNEESKNSNQDQTSQKSEDKPSSADPVSSEDLGTSIPTGHVHDWATEWSYDDTTHFHLCKTCGAKKDITAHTSGDYESVNLGEYLKDQRYKHSTVKMKACSDCGYNKIQDADVFPRLYFTYNASDPNADFATKATSMDIDRPELTGTFKLDNCGSEYAFEGVTGTMKVRGNQTAGFPKKGFRVKFDKGREFLGLNSGKKFKKWVLMADAKDSCAIRTQIGLSVSREIAEGTKVWVSDITPISVYLNGTYWGYYYLAEQKETKTGRINLPVPEGETSVNIGYNFELDHYASQEPSKADGGDPTFSLDYGNKFTNSSYNIESSLANPGPMKTYTLNSDIYDGPEGVALNPNNSNQVKFIRDRMQALFEVLYQAAIQKKAYTIGNDPADTTHYNKAYAASGMTVQQAIETNFDLEAWAVGFIINAFACPPDLGYSSFYMSFDNSATGDKKLRFDCPWDFDSNFGNRNNLITDADGSSSQGGWNSKDPYYMDRTSNMWIQYLSKLDFFMNVVKAKWNEVREKQVFERMFQMMRVYFKYYDYEARKNFQKWPEIKASDSQVGAYFSGELRDIFKDPKNRLQAQEETINWCAKRINYLEKKFGGNRGPVDTAA